MRKTKHYTPIKFQKRLKEEMDKRNMTAIQLGGVLGVDRKTIYSWYLGDTCPDMMSFYKICRLFGKTMEYMIGDD